MRKFFKKIKESGLFMFVVILLCSLFGITGGGAMTADALPNGGAGGMGNPEGHATYQNLTDDVPEIIENEVDQEIQKIRPYAFPLRVLSEHVKVKVKNSKSHIYETYDVSSVPVYTATAAAYGTSATVFPEVNTNAINFTNNKLIAVGETLYFPGIPGRDPVTAALDGKFFCAVVINREANGSLQIMALNGVAGVAAPAKRNLIPYMPAGTKVIRGSRSATETQINTDAFNATPSPTAYNLQKFLMKTKVSTWFEMVDKKVTWNKTEVTDEAIYEMKQTQNTDFWLGTGSRQICPNYYNENADELLYTMLGIWWQPDNDIHFGITAGNHIQKADLIRLCKEAFETTQGSPEKIFLLDFDLMYEILNVEGYDQTIYIKGDVKTELGMVVAKLVSPYGNLILKTDRSLNLAGLNNKGIIIDPAMFIRPQKRLATYTCDDKKNLKSDTVSQVFVEECCLILRNKKAHARVHLV
jgi:hypothetical protein